MDFLNASNWSNVCSTHQQPTVESIKQAVQQMQQLAVRKPDYPDVIVCTEAMLDKIKQQLPNGETPYNVLLMAQIPIQTSKTAVGAAFKALLLVEEGKQVMFVDDDNTIETSY